MPGLIWVRDLMVGDVMVDRSFRVERFRPLGLLGPPRGRGSRERSWSRPEALVPSWSRGVAERAVVSVSAQVVEIGSSAAGPSSRRMWKDRRASLRAIVSDARVCESPRAFSAR